MTDAETTPPPPQRWGHAYIAAPWQMTRTAFTANVWASIEGNLRTAVEDAGETYDPKQVRRATVSYKPDEHGALTPCPDDDPDRKEIHFRVSVVTP